MAERAVALEPANSDALRRYAYITNVIGRHDEAIDAAKRALEIDPGLSDNRLELGVDTSGRGAMRRPSRCFAS